MMFLRTRQSARIFRILIYDGERMNKKQLNDRLDYPMNSQTDNVLKISFSGYFWDVLLLADRL